MDLPTRSPTLRISPLAVALKCEHKTYEPSRLYPHTRASLIWTSPLILITCSSPIMNLPAHDTIKHLLIQVHIKTQLRKTHCPYTIVWRCLSAAKRNPSANRLAIPIMKSCQHGTTLLKHIINLIEVVSRWGDFTFCTKVLPFWHDFN